MHGSKPGPSASGLALLTAANGNAFKIDGSAPQVHFNGISNPAFTEEMRDFFEARMNGEVKAAFDTSLADANRSLSGFGSQKDLARAMANANAYASNAATLQGYPNYDRFAFSGGFMMAVQAPSFDPSAYDGIADKISGEGDVYLGVAAGIGFNLGMNCGFLVPGLYANVKYGALSKTFDDYAIDYKLFGFGVNYNLLQPKSFVGLAKWRGISIGTGFYMQMDELSVKIKVDTFRTDAKFREAVMAGAAAGSDSTDKEAILAEMGYGPGSDDAQVAINPVFKMGLDIATFTVPLEANTAVALFWGIINLNFGLGMDLNFGNAKVLLKGDSEADIEGNSTSKVTFDPATVTVDGSGENGPSFARLRAMTGLGLGLGPVKIDIPIIYYVKSGAAFGITGAFVW